MSGHDSGPASSLVIPYRPPDTKFVFSRAAVEWFHLILDTMFDTSVPAA